MSWAKQQRGLRVVTPRDLVDNGQWENYCEFQGINPGVIVSGEFDLDEELDPISEHVAKRFGL